MLQAPEIMGVWLLRLLEIVLYIWHNYLHSTIA